VKVLMSWSSGKDSAWTLHTLNTTHPGAVAALLTTYNEAFDRVAMHGVRRSVLEAQAAAAELPLWQVPIPDQCTNEIYDARMRDVCGRAVDEGFTHVAFGDLFLEDIRRYREERLAGTGLTPIFPLWQIPTPTLARQMLDGGLRATVAVVDTRVVPAEFAGRSFDDTLLRELPTGVDPCAENGEFHTCVTAGPMFRQALTISVGERVDRLPFVFRDIALAGATV